MGVLALTDIAERKATLEARLQELETRLARIDRSLGEAPNPDWEENAQESENDEVLEELGHVGEEEVLAIRAALKRVDAGTYGICVKCGEEISQERLDVLPYTPFCRACAANH